jgi:hypothetical protein
MKGLYKPVTEKQLSQFINNIVHSDKRHNGRGSKTKELEGPICQYGTNSIPMSPHVSLKRLLILSNLVAHSSKRFSYYVFQYRIFLNPLKSKRISFI